MMRQICDLETVLPQEIPQNLRKIMHYQISYIEAGEKEAFFLQSFNLPKCKFRGLLTLEGLCSLFFK